MTDNKEKEAGMEEHRIQWDDTKMETTYANVVNATSTREEVSLLISGKNE